MELLVAAFIVALVMPFLVRALSALFAQQQSAGQYLHTLQVQDALVDQLSSQWSRLAPAGCYQDEHAIIRIQSAAQPPLLLKSRSLEATSDWLAGNDYGLCRLSVQASSTKITMPATCYWPKATKVTFSSCQGRYKGTVSASGRQQMTVTLQNNAGVGQSGVIEAEQGFYWYLATGKSASLALWRTPSERGRSLELWQGLQKLAIYPLLDLDQDGRVDSIDRRYGDYDLRQVKALWVEFSYRLAECRNPQTTALTYRTLRGQLWTYQPPCEHVATHIIAINGD